MTETEKAARAGVPRHRVEVPRHRVKDLERLAGLLERKDKAAAVAHLIERYLDEEIDRIEQKLGRTSKAVPVKNTSTKLVRRHERSPTPMPVKKNRDISYADCY